MSNIANDIINMLKDKPSVEKSNTNWPTENGMYSISGIKKYMKAKGYTNDLTDQAIYNFNKDSKTQLPFIFVYNKHYKQMYPYFYMDLTQPEVDIIKSIYES